MTDRICPSCRRAMDASTKQPTPSADSPYRSPASAARADSPPRLPRVGHPSNTQPFVLQAARFSAFAPVALFVMGSFVRTLMQPGSVNASDKTWIALSFAAVAVLISLAAIVLGLIGFVGGVRLRWYRLLAYSIVGIVLNSGLIVLWFSAMFVRMQGLPK